MLRTILTIATCSLILSMGYAQTKVGSNVLSIDPASILELESDSSGFLPSRLTSIQRDAQTEWDEGHIIYNKTDNCLQIFDGSAWDCFVQGVSIDSTIYKYNDTLTSDRIVGMGGYQLTFDGSGDVVITAAGFVGIGDPTPEARLDVEDGTVRFSDYGQGNHNPGSESYLLGVDSDGDVIEVTPAIDTFSLSGDILRISIAGDRRAYDSIVLSKYLDDINIYKDNGTILGNRTIDLDGFYLRARGTDSGANIQLQNDGDIRQYGPGALHQLIDTSGTELRSFAGSTSTYVSSFTDVPFYLRQNNSNTIGLLANDYLRFYNYGDGIRTGTPTYLLGVDADGDVLDVDPSTIGSDDQEIDSIALVGTELQIGLERDVNGLQTLDLSSLQDGDNQVIDSLAIVGTELQIGIENDANGLQTLNLNTLLDRDWNALGGGYATDILDTIYTFGFVGINTSSPSAPFHVVESTDTNAGPWAIIEGGGGVRANTALQLYDKGTAANNEIKLEFAHNPNTGIATPLATLRSNSVGTNHANGADLTLETTSAPGSINADQVVLKNNGNVGIGTSTPDALLDVDGGTVRFSNYGSGSEVTGAETYILGVEVDGDVVEIDATTLGTNIYNTSDTLEADRQVTMDGNLLNFVGTDTLSITPSGGLGIGTSTPDALLDVDGGTVRFSNYGSGTEVTGAETYILGVEADGDIVEIDASSLGTNIYNTSDTIEAYRTVHMDGNDLNFIGSSETVAITSTGRLGVGITSPERPLHVDEALRLSRGSNTTSFIFDRYNGTLGTTWKSFLIGVNASSSGNGEFFIADYNENVAGGGFSRMFTLTDPTLPIRFDQYGTGAPAFNTGNEVAILGVEADGDIVEVDASSIGENIYNTSDTITADRQVTMDGNIISFVGTDTLTITSAGGLGIGTSSPDALLDVDGGSVRFSDYGEGTYSDSTTTSDTDYLLGADSDGDVVELNYGKNARWFYAPAVTIDASALISDEPFDLYQQYRDQFSLPSEKSEGAPDELPYYERDELYYYITFYDDSVLNIDSLTAGGVMTYDIVDVPFDNYTIMNVIFVIK